MDYTQRRKMQSEETQRKILDTALDLMRKKGFDQVSIRDICKAAGLTTGAFYHHFPSKEALLEHGFTPLDEYMRHALKSCTATEPEDKLRAILTAYAAFMEDSGELIGRYYQRRIALPNSYSIDATRYTYTAMLECFRQAKEEGKLSVDQPPEWMAAFCFRHFRGVVIDWVLQNYRYPLHEKMEEDYSLFASLF